MSHDPVQGSSTYRTEILRRLEIRERNQRAMTRLFNDYSSLADEFRKTRRIRRTTYSEAGETSSQIQLNELKAEIAQVYKDKSKNDQELIVANRKLEEMEGELLNVTEQRDKLLAETEKLTNKLAVLEDELHELKEINSTVNIERIALQTTVHQLTERRRELENDRISLISKIGELQEKRAEFLNAEVAKQEERRQATIQEQIARATQDITFDERASSAHGHSSPISDEFLMTDVIPEVLKFKLNVHEGEVNDVEWFSDDTFATAGSDNKLRIWRVSSGKNEASKTSTLTGCNGPITRIDYDPQRNVCLASSNDKTCRIWNINTQRLLTTFSGHTDKVTSARFFQNSHVVSGALDRTIKIWDISSIRCLRTIMFPSKCFDIATKFNPEIKFSFASAHYDKKVRFWDERQSDPIKHIDLGERVTSLDISLDGLQLLTSCRDDTLSVIDVRTFHELHRYASESYHSSTDNARSIFSSTGEYVVSGDANGTIFIWNTKTTKLEKVLKSAKTNSNAILSLSWNQSGRGLLACDRMKTCFLWR